MDIYEMRRQISAARNTLENADQVAGSIAILLPGRLRHCSSTVLEKLKKELKDYNIHTGQWKD